MTGLSPVRSGLDVLVSNNFSQLKGKRVGLVASQASIDSGFNHAADLLGGCPDCRLVKLFAAEYGFRSEFDSLVPIERSIDIRTGLRVVSLYGDNEKSTFPRAEDLQDIDIIVVDLPEFGRRPCGFIQTVAHLMDACRQAGKMILILDRPNPLGGEVVEGPGVASGARSFVGIGPIPVRHGMTLGELAVMIHQGFGKGEDRFGGIACELGIVPLEGWMRSMYWEDTGLPWVMPAPGLPTVESAFVACGTCLFEGTNVSEGRGTAKPYEIVGAPFVDAVRWCDEVPNEGISLEGACLRPITFIPRHDKFADKYCFGLQIHVTDRGRFMPVRWALALLGSLSRLYREEFFWRTEPYEFEAKTPAIDLLFGSIELRKCIERKRKVSELEGSMAAFEEQFLELRKPFLLY